MISNSKTGEWKYVGDAQGLASSQDMSTKTRQLAKRSIKGVCELLNIQHRKEKEKGTVCQGNCRRVQNSKTGPGKKIGGSATLISGIVNYDSQIKAYHGCWRNDVYADGAWASIAPSVSPWYEPFSARTYKDITVFRKMRMIKCRIAIITQHFFVNSSPTYIKIYMQYDKWGKQRGITVMKWAWQCWRKNKAKVYFLYPMMIFSFLEHTGELHLVVFEW